MNREGEKSAKTALHNQRQPRTQQNKKKQHVTSKEAQSVSCSKDAQSESVPEMKTAGQLQGKRAGKVSSSAGAERQRSPGAQRKLSDASNASEDLSKDSGCLSEKLSSSDSSSEISDCPSEGNKQDNELSWIDGKAYVSPDSEGTCDQCAGTHTCALRPDAPGGGLGLFHSSGALMDFMMGATTEDLAREVEDLRSENEYLKVS